MKSVNLLSVNNLLKIGREQPLFSDVTFGLDEGDKAALIGRNGSGKSTLLSIIAGNVLSDGGNVVLNKEAGISYLAQNPVFEANDTIEEHIFSLKATNSNNLRIIHKYEDLCEKMESGLFNSALKAEYDSVIQTMDSKNLWNYEAQIRSILGVLGIHDLTRKMGELSGGMVKKVALAAVLVEDTKLLLLDEPTNHLDISTIYWLQNYLAGTKRTVLLVTHDRYFLDNVCNHIWELSRQKIKLYKGNYSDYLEKKEVEAQIEANTERRIESVLRFERDWLLRGPCARGTKAKARIQHDMALINREKFREDAGFTFHVEGRRLGGKVLELHHITKNFPKGFSKNRAENSKEKETPVLRDFSYTFNKGEKIGIFGDNGSGKSTLLNIITGTLAPDEGNVVVGQNTLIAYYQQNPVFKDLNTSVLEYAKEAAEVMHLSDGTTLSDSLFLEQFGFTGKIQHSPLASLSGGERKRLFLVRLLLLNPNFLILDEPTNDFDIFTMNILEQFLLGFTGCILLVSHDRYFMDKIADTLLILEDDGSVSGYVGKCSEFIQYRELKAAEKCNAPKEQEVNKKSKEKAQNENANKAEPTFTKPKKRSFKEEREFATLEKEIEELEKQQKIWEEKMASQIYEESFNAGKEYEKISLLLEKKYERWEELA